MKQCLTLLLTIIGAKLLAADTLSYSIRNYTDENGLPQNSVKYVAPDRSGFIWLATENGLVRYDGLRFKQFNRSNIDISESRIFHILPSLDQRYLYASTRDEYEKAIRIDRGKAAMDYSYIHPSVFFIKKFRFDPRIPVYSLAGYPDPYFVNADYYFIPIDSNNIFAITKTHVEFYSGNSKKLSSPLPHLLPEHHWTFFRMNRELFALKHFEVFAMLNGQFVHTGKLIGDIEHNPLYQSPKAQLEIYWNMAAGEVFVFLSNQLYAVVPGAGGKLTTRLVLSGFDLPYHKIASVYYDTVHGRIFLGSYTKGLYILERKKFSTMQSGRTVGDENYYAQTPFSDSSVLTAQGELIGRNASSQTLPHIKETQHFAERNTILTDSKGNIWAKQKDSLYKFNSTGSVLIHKWKLPEPITQLYEGKNGHLWIGTFKSVYRMSLHQEIQEPVLIKDGFAYVSYLQEESADILWIGTHWGLYQLNMPNSELTFIPELHRIDIRSLYIPRKNEIWITTYETGFYLYKNNKLTNFPLDKNHYLLASHCIVEDERGYFWIPTNKGLFQVARKDLLAYANREQQHVYYLYYTKEYGFGTNEFNGGCQPCALQLKNGTISLPSLNGLVWFNPASLNMDLPDKELVVGELQVDQLPVTPGDTISLADKFRQLKLFLYTPYFGDENNIVIEFSLNGNSHTPAWLPVNSDNSITLSSLPAGSHVLQIRKLNGFGKDNYTYKTVVLIVPPAFYETWLFRAVLALLLISGIITYMRFRLKAAHRKNKLLEIHVAERTHELQHTLVALTDSEKKLRQQTHLQDQLIAAITHDIKSPLKYMAITARHVHQELFNIQKKDMLHTNTKVLYNSAYRMYHLTDNMLQYVKFYSRNENKIRECVNLYNLVEEKTAIFHDIAAASGATIVNNIPPALNITTNGQLLGIIMHNLLDNACKYSAKGTITLSAHVSQQHIEILVEDNGRGMDPETVNWCNTATAEMEELASANSIPSHLGLGLTIVKELVTVINGKLTVKSERNAGSSVSILLQEQQDPAKVKDK